MEEKSKGTRFGAENEDSNINNNNKSRYYGRARNNNQSQADSPTRPATPLVGDESISEGQIRVSATNRSRGGADLADEILRFFESGDDENRNATGTNVLLSEGFQGVDPLIALKDCCCKSPLLESLKKQTEALKTEKEAHEATLSKRVITEREARSLRSQISDFVERERRLTADKVELDATVEQLKADVQAQTEAARNGETLVERIRSELVIKHGELAREAQRGNRAEADVALLEQQIETLRRQVSEYDKERMSSERGRGDLQSRFVEEVAKMKTLAMETNMEKDDLMQKIALMREQVKITSQQKATAEKACRSYRERVETLTAASSNDRTQIRELEEALNLEETRHEGAATEMKNEIDRLEKLIHDIKSEALTEMTGLDRSRGQCNNLLMRATKEIAHLDQTTEDMRKHLEALNSECQSLKEEKKALEDETKSNEEKWNHEREKLRYEIGRLGKVSAEMDEGRNEAEIKILELQNKLSDAESLLQIKEKEREDLEETMDKRTESLNNALKGATEAIRAELEAVKAALKAKSTELQNLKASVNSAGGDVSLMPLDREDYQRTLRESEELKRENDELKEELIRSSARESSLESELEAATGRGEDEELEGLADESEEAATELDEKVGREERLTAELLTLQGQVEEMREALTAAEEETAKLTSIFKETLAAAPIDIHAELYQKKVAQRTAAVDEHEYLAGKGGTDGGNDGGSDDEEEFAEATAATAATTTGKPVSPARKSSRNSLLVLVHQMKVARNYQLQKGVGDAMKRVGLDNEELTALAKTYEGEHHDFNEILEQVLHKAQKYRAERNSLANQVKEFKVEIHFLKLELNLYKELEIKMKELGGIDEEALKNAKVDVAEKLAKQPRGELDPDVAAAIDAGKAAEYVKSSIVKMTTMFAEQKHILDLADEFRSLDDFLKALREDITSETTSLKKKIASLIRLVGGMEEENVHAIGAKKGTCRDEGKDGKDDDKDDGEGGNDDGSSSRGSRGSVKRAVDSERVSSGNSRQSGRRSLREAEERNENRVVDSQVFSGRNSRESGRRSLGEAEEGNENRAVDRNSRQLGRLPLRASDRGSSVGNEDEGIDKLPLNGASPGSIRSGMHGSTTPASGRFGDDLTELIVKKKELRLAVGMLMSATAEGFDEVGSDSNLASKWGSRKDKLPLNGASPGSSHSGIHGSTAPASGRFGDDLTEPIVKKKELRSAVGTLTSATAEGFDKVGSDSNLASKTQRGSRKEHSQTASEARLSANRGADEKSNDAENRSANSSVAARGKDDEGNEVMKDVEGNVWTKDDAGRRWIVDQDGRMWRLGLDGRQYMIDNDGVKWTVEEVNGRRRRWRLASRGEYLFAEEDGVEWVVVDDVDGGRRGCARRKDEEGNEVMKDAEGAEWILDEVGRGWREDEKGQMILLDKEGRVWKFDESREFGRRRDALGQKWKIDLHGAFWLVADDGRGWRVDSKTNILAVETTAGARIGGKGSEGCGWLMERSTGVQWLVDKDRRRLRAARMEEALTIPPEVKMALKAESAAAAATKGEADSENVGGKSRTTSGKEKDGRREAATAEEEEEGRRKGRSGKVTREEESEDESLSSMSSLDAERRMRRNEKGSRPMKVGRSTPSLTRARSLRRTPSQLRAEAALLRQEVASRRGGLALWKNANDAFGEKGGSSVPRETDETSYYRSMWGL